MSTPIFGKTRINKIYRQNKLLGDMKTGDIYVCISPCSMNRYSEPGNTFNDWDYTFIVGQKVKIIDRHLNSMDNFQIVSVSEEIGQADHGGKYGNRKCKTNIQKFLSKFSKVV